MLRAAGIGPGMSVLDVGSGAGDVALLLADLVGPRGRVLGIDANPEVLVCARTRAAAVGLGNVDFRAGRLETFDLPPGFDAVVGRWVLMYLPDPVSFLGHLTGALRPGAIVAFNEMDLGIAREPLARIASTRRPCGKPSGRSGRPVLAFAFPDSIESPNRFFGAPASGAHRVRLPAGPSRSGHLAVHLKDHFAR
jgi:SAM-dependent methyltransferase